MKKLLLTALLILGCDLFESEEGICVLINIETNSYSCYPQTTESQCNKDAKRNESIILRYWGERYDCNEFCNSVIPNEECEIS